jgi:hypothetical protein
VSLETQFGEDGHGANLESETPRFVGRVPAHESRNMLVISPMVKALIIGLIPLE